MRLDDDAFYSNAAVISRWANLACWGLGVANKLNVTTSGLRAGAGESESLAARLTAGPIAGGAGSHASLAGLNALDSAIRSVRDRQSRRMSGQAADMSAGGTHYDDTDDGAAGAIAVTV
ncbi:hypothetical protein ACWDTP_03600 [Mycobacterium sp. NPDC003449]